MPSLAVTTPFVPCDARVAPTSAHLLKKLVAPAGPSLRVDAEVKNVAVERDAAGNAVGVEYVKRAKRANQFRWTLEFGGETYKGTCDAKVAPTSALTALARGGAIALAALRRFRSLARHDGPRRLQHVQLQNRTWRSLEGRARRAAARGRGRAANLAGQMKAHPVASPSSSLESLTGSSHRCARGASTRLPARPKSFLTPPTTRSAGPSTLVRSTTRATRCRPSLRKTSSCWR